MPCAYLLSVLFVPLSFLSPPVLSSLPVAGSIPRPTFVSLVSFLFFACLVLLFGALPSSPPDVSPVPTSSWAGLPHSFYSALSPSSYTSFGVSHLPSVSGNLLLPGLLPVMLPCLMCWLRLLALPLQCLLPSIFLMSSFLPLQVFVWALWWLQVLWCKILMIVVFIPFCTFSTAGSGYPVGGGGVLSLLRSSSCSVLRRRFPVAILLSSGSWSGKFPIERCYLWG